MSMDHTCKPIQTSRNCVLLDPSKMPPLIRFHVWAAAVPRFCWGFRAQSRRDMRHPILYSFGWPAAGNRTWNFKHLPTPEHIPAEVIVYYCLNLVHMIQDQQQTPKSQSRWLEHARYYAPPWVPNLQPASQMGRYLDDQTGS